MKDKERVRDHIKYNIYIYHHLNITNINKEYKLNKIDNINTNIYH